MHQHTYTSRKDNNTWFVTVRAYRELHVRNCCTRSMMLQRMYCTRAVSHKISKTRRGSTFKCYVHWRAVVQQRPPLATGNLSAAADLSDRPAAGPVVIFCVLQVRRRRQRKRHTLLWNLDTTVKLENSTGVVSVSPNPFSTSASK